MERKIVRLVFGLVFLFCCESVIIISKGNNDVKVFHRAVFNGFREVKK